MNVHRMLRSVESLRAVDRPAAAAARGVRRVLRATRTDGLIRGRWLGHPVHPLLVTLPIGAWLCAAVLDIKQRDAARRLVAIGLAATPPTVLAGVADFSGLNVEQRRVAVVHAAANVVSAGCFAASYVYRLRRQENAGTAWSTLGLLAVGAGGALGGHLSYAQGGGVYRWQKSEGAPTG
jgi:uncharacterized membrane protein